MFMLFLKELRHRWVVHTLIVVLMAFIMSLLVIQSSISGSAEERIKELSHDLGRGMLVVPAGTDLESFYEMKYGPQVMPDDYGDRIKNSPLRQHAGMIDPRLYGNITIQGKDLIIVGHQSRSGKNQMLLAGGAAAALGLKRGDTLKIQGETFNIARVMDTPPKGYDMALFVPLKAAQRIMGKPGKINALHMGGCWCKLDIPAFAASVENTLPGTMAITVEGMAKAQTQINDIMKRYSVVLWAAGIILVVGSIAFLIIYIIRKSEREIGLLMSIGMSPLVIIAKNIIIATVTALAGVLLGHALSVPLMSWFGKSFMRVSLSPSMEFMPQFIAVSAAVALIASSIPSWYVTKLDPAKTLREE